ncbi:MAG: methyltransferase domain-containing protein [Nostoc sp.]|uniref:methyltransferase domain-containing protein n=1 Tax=Nostoc sp. TaxID=1180 RepID=UPI002FFC26EB
MQEKAFQYYIDTPSHNKIINSPFVLISGWIIYGKGSVIEDLSICYANKPLQALTIVSRPDVQLAYPDHSVFGFSDFLLFSDFSIAGKFSIEFTIDHNKHGFLVDFEFDSEIGKKFIHDKQEKLNKIRNILRCPICGNEEFSNIDDETSLKCLNCQSEFNFNTSKFNLLTQELIVHGIVKSTENISANKYDSVAINIIQQFKNGLILDNGCGLRDVYYDNIVNFEIVDYPTTDVIGIGEKLPFKSEVFDAVFSLAVLEHVRNPFECAQEITRVLKPGGTLYAAVPFLQPFHGYPDHYYNMTSSGLKNLFSEEFEILECSVPQAGLPVWCLTWFLNSYIRGLPEAAAKNFKNMKISDLLEHPHKYLEQDFVTQLSPQVNEELACVNCLIARKL